MKRRLDDTKVGEYKTNWWWTFFYTIMIVAGIVGIFLFPITQNGVDGVSPVNYLYKGDYKNFLGNCSLFYVALVAILFINTFFTLSIPRLGKSVVVKINKIFELLLALSALTLHVVYVLYYSSENFEVECKYFCFWMTFTVVIMIFSLINYYETKKISIYD